MLKFSGAKEHPADENEQHGQRPSCDSWKRSFQLLPATAHNETDAVPQAPKYERPACAMPQAAQPIVAIVAQT